MSKIRSMLTLRYEWWQFLFGNSWLFYPTPVNTHWYISAKWGHVQMYKSRCWHPTSVALVLRHYHKWGEIELLASRTLSSLWYKSSDSPRSQHRPTKHGLRTSSSVWAIHEIQDLPLFSYQTVHHPFNCSPTQLQLLISFKSLSLPRSEPHFGMKIILTEAWQSAKFLLGSSTFTGEFWLSVQILDIQCNAQQATTNTHNTEIHNQMGPFLTQSLLKLVGSCTNARCSLATSHWCIVKKDQMEECDTTKKLGPQKMQIQFVSMQTSRGDTITMCVPRQKIVCLFMCVSASNSNLLLKRSDFFKANIAVFPSKILKFEG